MFRRIVCSFLLPCVLLTQSSAVLAHAHVGGEPAGHDLLPHFHTNKTAAPRTRDHGHHHHDPGGHHHHPSDEAPEPDVRATTGAEPVSGHDSDAVFIASVDVVVNDRSAVDDEVTASSFMAAFVPSAAAQSEADTQYEPPNWTRPPPAGCVCALYVRHLTLLI